MKNYSVLIKVFKYSHFKWNEEKIFNAENKSEAKQIARSFISSNEWAMDLTPKPDLRTLRELR